MKKLLTFLMFFLLATAMAQMQAETKTVTYTVTSTSSVTVSGTPPSTTAPDPAYSSTYTTAKQLTNGKYMQLTLYGFSDKKITGITLSMRSNSSGGAGYFSMKAGSTTLASIGSTSSGVKFNDAKWNGSWSTSYTDVTPQMTNNSYVIQQAENVVILIGATENSLYCESFKVTYEDEGTTPDPDPSGDGVTYNFGDFTVTDGVATIDTENGFTITLNKNTGSTAPTWNANSSEARVYAKGSVVISSEKDIVKVVYNYVENAGGSNKTVPTIDYVKGSTNAGTWTASTKTWTGDDKTVTLSTSGSAGNLGFKSITVYFKESDPTPSGPSIEAESTLNLTAAEGDGTFNVTWTNAADMDVNLYTNESCTTTFTGDWFQVDLDDNNNVYYIVASNAELTPRTVYMRLYALGEDSESEATKVVTVTQAGKDPAPLAVITAESTLGVPYTGVEEGSTFNVTWENAESMDVYLYTDEGCTTKFDGSWFLAEINKDDNNVYYIADANTETAPRTVYMQLMALNADAIVTTKVVTVTQEAAPVTKYAITIAETTNGEVTADKTEAAEGEEVTLTVTPAEHYSLESLTVAGESGNVTVTDGKFTMPAEAVTVTATFVENQKYTITWRVNGEVAKTENLYAGETVSAPAVPETIVNGETTYTFTGKWANAEITPPEANEPTDRIVTPQATATAAATYYAVYAIKGQGGEGASTSISSYADGKYVVVDVYDGKYYAINGGVTSKKISASEITPAVTANADGSISIDFSNTSIVDDMKYDLSKSNGIYTISQNGTAYWLQPKGNDLGIDLSDGFGWTGFVTDNNFTGRFSLTANGTNGKGSATSNCLLMQASSWDSNIQQQVPTLVFKGYAQVNRGQVTEKSQCYASGYMWFVPVGGGGTTWSNFTTLVSAEPVVTLSSIAVSGEYQTEFNVGDTFNHDGAIVTATYSDGTDADVTSEADFTGYDMSTAGTQTVTVSYTEGGVTKTTTYSITVNAPEPVVGDFVLISSTDQLVDGGEYIIATRTKENGDYELSLDNFSESNKNVRRAVSTTLSEDLLIAPETEGVAVLTLNGSEGNWTLSNGTNYLRLKSASNYLQVGENDEYAKMSISFDGDNAVMVFNENAATTDNKTRSIQFNYNNGAPRYAVYAGTQTPVYLYRKGAPLPAPEAPVFSPEDGVHYGKTKVTMTSASSTAEIRYTTDGSEPTAESTLYTGAIILEPGATVNYKAVAVRRGVSSEVVTASYEIQAAPVATGDFVLVTSKDDLVAGREYVIVAKDVVVKDDAEVKDYALSTENSFLNGRPEDSEGKTRVSPDHRKAVADVTLSYEDFVATIKPSVSVLTLEAVEVAEVEEGQTPKFKFNSAMGYLVPKVDMRQEGATDDAGMLVKTNPENDAEVATITIDDNNVAHIKFDANTGREILFNFNKSGERFSAYKRGANDLKDVYLYYREAQPQSYLVDIEANGLDGHNYTIKDELQVVWTKDNVLWAKDNADSYAKRENVWTAEGVNNYLSREYSQNNWIRIILPAGTVGAQYAGKMITAGSVNGTYHGYRNLFHTITVSGDLSVSSDASTYTPNTYCMANFWDENTYDYVIASTGNKFFFMNPKVEEVCTITEAIWQGSNTFVVPANQTIITSGGQEVHLNSGDLKGAFKVNWEYNDAGQGVTTEQLLNYLGSNNDQRFKFNGAVTKVDKAVAQKAPAKVLGSNGLNVDGQNQYYEVFALDMAPDTHIVTEVKDVDVAGREVKSVRFYDIAGRARSEAQPGINIVVTEYTDGTHSTAKMVR